MNEWQMVRWPEKDEPGFACYYVPEMSTWLMDPLDIPFTPGLDAWDDEATRSLK